MKPIIEFHNICKTYQIGHELKAYSTFRDSLTSLFRRSTTTKEDFYALKDISFELNEGDTLGIIGKNGAGKSTLLKVLSRITSPSSGHIVARGRMASLLEVGTGFHPELTGSENIFLNGSILGLKRAEIKSKFDEIVEFSGVKNFLDTPLKHYSSGMQLRLAFAVAAHLEPEILIIDEVLAVGDAEFQRKCLGKMNEVSRSGRTILFVSHNMAAIESLCTKSIVLSGGQLKGMGTTSEMINLYLNEYSKGSGSLLNGKLEFSENDSLLIRSVEVNGDGIKGSVVSMGGDLQFRVNIESTEIIHQPVLGLVFRNMQEVAVLGINNRHYGIELSKTNSSNFDITFEMKNTALMPGIYSIDLFLGDGAADLDSIPGAFTIEVESRDIMGSGLMPSEKLNTFFHNSCDWRIS